jgi:hypothetical protein
MSEINECILVSVDFTNGDENRILLVGRQKEGFVEVINAFQGQEAQDLYDKLTTMVIWPDKKEK